jgi:hypothetical protein
VTRNLIGVGYLLLIGGLVSCLGQSATPAPPAVANTSGVVNAKGIDLQTIVTRLQQAQAENRQNLRAYVVTREYQLFSDSKPSPSSRVTAQVNFVPPDVKHYVIKDSQGSDRGEKVVRKVLDQETKTSPQETRQRDLNPENYHFTLDGTGTLDGHTCYVLGLHPRRKAEGLVDGKLWVDANSFLPRKVDGDISKSPSWWLKRVHLDLTFKDVEGMWLQTNTQAVADVRFLGKHTLTSSSLAYQTADVVARNSPSPLGSSTHPIPAKPSPSGTVQHQAPVRRPTWPVPQIVGAGILGR